MHVSFTQYVLIVLSYVSIQNNVMTFAHTEYTKGNDLCMNERQHVSYKGVY